MNKAYNMDIQDWKKFPDYDIIYCDPPWEQRMVRYFETLMYKDGQEKPNNSIDSLIHHLGKLSDKSKPIFIEYSISGSDRIVQIMTSIGHKLCGIVNSTQENGNEYLIIIFNTNGYLPDGRNRGFKIIESICSELSFMTVFDPFAGVGKTASAFIKCGKSYIGSEINTNRFNRLKKVLWEEQL